MKKAFAFLLLPLSVLVMIGCQKRTTTKPTTKPRPTTKDTTTTKEDPIPQDTKTIYVSNAGLDTSDGSTRENATSLSHALELYKTGDTIKLLSGTYTLDDVVELEKSGVSKKKNEFIGEDEVILDFIQSKDEESDACGLRITGSNWLIENITVINSYKYGFSISGSGCDITNCVSSGNGDGGFFINNASQTKLTNCIAKDNTYTGKTAHGFYVAGSGIGNYIDSCVSCNNQDSGFVTISSKSVSFYKCIASDNGLEDYSSYRSGFVFNNKGHIFDNCIAYNNASVGFNVPNQYVDEGSYKIKNCSAINNHARNFYLRKNNNVKVTIENVLSYNTYDSDDNGTIDALKDIVLGDVTNSIFFFNNTTNSYNYASEVENYSSSNVDTIVPLDLSTYTNQFVINLTVPEAMKEYIDLDAKAVIDAEAAVAGVEPDYSSLEYNIIYYKDGHIYIYDYLDRSVSFQDELFTKEEILSPTYFGAYVNE